MPTILTTSDDEARDLARHLLDAADDPADVRIVTEGDRQAFVVSDELALAAGLYGPVDDEPENEEPEEVSADEPADDEAEQPAEAPVEPVLDPPDRNATTEEWAEFMATVPGAESVVGKTRGKLIADWDRLHPTAD